MSDELNGKVVVITGASSGIGAALAEIASARGAKVVLAARRPAELDVVAKKCAGETLALVTDVTKRDDVQRLADAAIQRFGHVDAWVNNAGRGITRNVEDLTDADLDEMFLVNVKSALYGIQAVLPHFKARGSGHIVNVSSMLGRVPFASSRSAYNASKHALNALTANLRVDLRATHPGIRVSLVLPGIVATDFGLNALHGGIDNRKLPNPQPVEEVAQVMAELLANPRAEAYTRPGYKEQVVGYFSADLDTLETTSPMFAARPPVKR
jgi:NAD(P)-dependent dehydrogenase (short-subunit alcohol dehydrogenase family)